MAQKASKVARATKRNGLEVTHGGETYTFHEDDFTALDAKAFRSAVGVSLATAFTSPDLDTVAGLVWLKRRADEPTLQFDAVAGNFGYSDLATIRPVTEGEGDDANPEA